MLFSRTEGLIGSILRSVLLPDTCPDRPRIGGGAGSRVATESVWAMSAKRRDAGHRVARGGILSRAAVGSAQRQHAWRDARVRAQHGAAARHRGRRRHWLHL